MTDEPDFVRRWSRRKQAARRAAEAKGKPQVDEVAVDAAGGEAPAASDSADDRDSPDAGEEALELPDIDSLSSESDFRPFLKKGVPKELRNRALRKLWRVNPVFGQLDGLNDYDGDFTDAASVVKGLKTLYKVGQGIVLKPDPEPAPEPTASTPSAEEPAAIVATDETAEPDDQPVEPDPEAAPDGSAEGNKVT